MTTTMVPRLFTVAELSKALGIAKWRISDMVARGEAPPHLRGGKTYRFPENSVVHWIAERQTTTAPQE